MDALTTTGLTKAYGRASGRVRLPGRGSTGLVRALEDVSISVKSGEIFGFLGPNGAGKSTTIRLLLGFIHPSAGGGTVLGLDIVRDSVAIRSRVGYLPGGIALYDSLSGERLLDYLGELTGRPSVRRAELVDRLELSSRTLARPVRDYSRGMRQKMGIIQALQHDPELAILDEPTEGLDPLMQRSFYAILDDLKAAGRTIFFSSHVLSEVERVCDRVAILDRGRLVIEAALDRLLADHVRPLYRFTPEPGQATAVAALVAQLQATPWVGAVTDAPDGAVQVAVTDPEAAAASLLPAIAAGDVRVASFERVRPTLEDVFLELVGTPAPEDLDGRGFVRPREVGR